MYSYPLLNALDDKFEKSVAKFKKAIMESRGMMFEEMSYLDQAEFLREEAEAKADEYNERELEGGDVEEEEIKEVEATSDVWIKLAKKLRRKLNDNE